MKRATPILSVFAAIFCIALFFPTVSDAQKRRDYLTEAEIELVRDNQEVDLRIGVLTHAIDRRLAVINNQPLKEKEAWGESPKGTRLELLIDIEKLIQKAIDDIDDVARRGADSKLFPKAVHKLTEACQGYLPQFKKFLDATKDDKERGSLLGSIENCNSVIEADAKVPKETEKKKN